MQVPTSHSDASAGLSNLVGKSPALVTVLRDLPAIALSGGTVLVTGETGTGKELVARAVHYLSERAAYPFVAINCGSFAEGLLENELFGHDRGAYTGAHSQRQGVVAQAESGTLFLDEVDTLSSKAQVALLRVLQERTYRPVGASREVKANVRVVAASNSALEKLVHEGRFRSDLFYRLCVFSVHLPPLRKRSEDILPLAFHFLLKYAPRDRPELFLSVASQDFLLAHHWPGNVRELESAILRGIHFTPGQTIEVEHLRMGSNTTESTDDSDLGAGKLESLRKMKSLVVERFERSYLTRLMEEHQGNISQAARFAGKERRDLGKLLKRHHVDPERFRLRAALVDEKRAREVGESAPTKAG